MIQKFKPASLLLVTSLFVLMSGANAQLTQATLKGLVTDSSEGALEGANIVVTSDGTGEARSAHTDSSGAFVLAGMNPGVYTLKISAAGFRTLEQRALVLNVGRTTELVLKLDLSSVQTDVEVVDTLARVPVSSEARLSDTFTKAEIADLPLPSRDVYLLTKLSAGATNIPGAASSTKLNSSPVVTVNGNRYRGNNYVLDGALNVNPNNSGEPSIVPSIESLQEAQIQTDNFSSEYGRGNGSVVNLSTKSGTNQFHGRGWEVSRNAALNARNFFSAVKAPQIYNQFGANAGGPVIHNKTFFFGSYEGTRSVLGQALTFQVETPEFRNYVVATNPQSIAAQLMKKYPAPVPQAGQLTKYAGEIDLTTPIGVIPAIGRAGVTLNNYSTYNQYLGRLDHSMRDGKDHISARWIDDHQADQGGTSNSAATLAEAVRGEPGPFHGDFANLNLGYMHLLAKAVNDARFSIQLIDSTRGDPNAVIPQISITGLTAPFGDTFLNETRLRSWELRDTVTFERGRHSLRVGGEWRRIFKGIQIGPATAGTYSFSNLTDFAADRPFKQTLNVDPATGQPVGYPRYFHLYEYAIFVQEDWKVTPRFNVNAGVRQDYFGVPSENSGLLSSIIFGPGDTFDQRLASASVGRVKNLYNVPKLNLSPRIGLAYDPFGDGKSSIRAGFSIAYQPHHGQSIAGARANPPDAIAGVVQPNVGIGTQILYGIPVPFNAEFARGLNTQGGLISPAGQAAVRISAWVVNPTIKTQYSESWFFNMQRQFLKDWIVEVGYVGTTGVNLERIDDVNRQSGDLLDGKLDRINHNFDAILFVTNGVTSHYNAFTAEVRHAFSKSLSLQANYRWSKWLDDGSDTSTGQFADNSEPGKGAYNVNCLKCEYGHSLFDIPHRFSTALLYAAPGMGGNNRIAALLTKHWEVSSIVTIQSGRPFSVFNGGPSNVVNGVNKGGDYNLDGGGGAVAVGYYDRPNAPLTPLGNFSQSDFINGLFSPSAFPVPALGQTGNLGRNTFRGPRYMGFDLSVSRTFRIVAERLSLQVRGEAFNAFNNVSLYLPNTDLSLANGTSTSIFGKSTQAFDPRVMQVSARLIF